MNDQPARRIWIAAIVVVLIAAATGLYVMRRGHQAAHALPEPGSAKYDEMVSAFYAGVAALDVDAGERAQTLLARAVELVPEEPAAWANRGLLSIRLGSFESAARDLEKARTLAPNNGQVEELLGLLESRRGRYTQAIAHLRRAIELDPGNLKAQYAVVKEIQREGETNADAEALRLTATILERRPENVVVLLERARLAGKLGESAVFQSTVAVLAKLAPNWPTRARELFKTLEESAKADLSKPTARRQAATRVVPIKNTLVQAQTYRQSLNEVETPVGMVGEPIEEFLKLERPVVTPAPPDDGLHFVLEPIPFDVSPRWGTGAAVSLTGEGPARIFTADGRNVRQSLMPGFSLPFPGGDAANAPSLYAIASADLNSDYRTDLVVAGSGGLRIYLQSPEGKFSDATEATKLEPKTRNADYFGAWCSDVEMDGDLDIIAAPNQGKPLVFRNNGDGTFAVVEPFELTSAVRDFAWGDLDQDGDPDAAFVSANGELSVFANERAGRFVRRTGLPELASVAAITASDIDADMNIDLVLLQLDGAVRRLSSRGDDGGWEVADLARAASPVEGPARLFAEDLDNNGSADLIGTWTGGGILALGDGTKPFVGRELPEGLRVFAIADQNGDGRLDIVGLSREGRALRGLTQVTRAYHWQVLRPRAAKVVGDGRINSFGVGGEIDVRAGLIVRKRVIQGPTVHFGLGTRPVLDVARIVWPNGTVQGEFDLKADYIVAAEQRLKGSCPFLFAYDGSAMRFVTDFIWRSPLGLRINAQDTAGVSQTEDWVKIAGDQLAPRDGHYDIRITAELWETHYFDHMALMAVDHPAGTEVFVDERFARVPPPLLVRATGPLRPLARVLDDRGTDVTETVRTRDGRYLDTFGRGFYQGVARDHWVEAELRDEIPRDQPLVLVAHGWIHPTDSSINVALAQGQHEPPRGLVLEVPARDGSWKALRDDIGFPAGKNKTILVDLKDAFGPNAPRRFRLRTNLEVFWDSLAIAVPEPQTKLETRRLSPASAELRPRGYSQMTQADSNSPEIPRYDRLAGTGQHWRDLIGFYTRFGDVRELVEEVDDRYVIANAGDELVLRYPALPPPASGWVRDFVMIGDGWNKDGDYNTAFSKTVLPLPSHHQSSYDAPPGALEDDPVYRFHPEDWQQYHTRYITPRAFQETIRPRRARGSESVR